MSADLERGYSQNNYSQKSLVGKASVRASSPLKIANPASLGLFSFASTTFVLSLFNLQTRNIHTPNVVVGMAIFCGGLAQLLAGMWEFPKGNVFGATAFTSYGAFWMSYATILLPGSGIIAAYTDPTELANSLAIYLTAWTMVTFFLLLVSLRKSIAFIALFASLTLTFALLTAAEFLGNASFAKGGGAIGVITAFIAYYIGVSELMAAEVSPTFNLPLGKFQLHRRPMSFAMQSIAPRPS